ncbi:MAG: glycoside hydrolase [Kiritimatiellia bacterium]
MKQNSILKQSILVISVFTYSLSVKAAVTENDSAWVMDNDADPEPGQPVKRVAQGYYPKTWVHSVPGTFIVAVLTDSAGKAPELTKHNNRAEGFNGGVVSGMRKGEAPDSLTYSLCLTYRQVKPVNLDVELKLLNDKPGLEISLSCHDGGEVPINTFCYPAPLYPPQPEKYFMAMTDYCDGRYIPVGDKSFRNKRLNSYGGDMPWVTVTDGRLGMKHGLINGRFNPEDMEQIKELGWLVGEYDNYEDINDSPTLGRGKAPVKDHALVKEDGELMTAWITRDKDMNPVHTYMKQCTAMMVKNAKAVIPEVLETYPYNTRFLDVTTSTYLKECYSPAHGVTRSEDLVHRQNLLKYLSSELGLVTGGEHGRFYGVPYLHYHEGMMGGGMYSWPAGYLRDVEKREDISEKYLNYGINPANRAPLFELVFHDCAVNYWYWGACSDYLHQVMPELTDRKTAMNVLYGTPPMMWSHKHGLHWNIPEEQELMLTIYRNVCKLHEIVGPQEMISHAFLKKDRMAQRCTFEDSTACTVNFGREPFTFSTAKRKGIILRENDFYVEGPEITQWRFTSDDGESRQTYIKTDDYLFAESGRDELKLPGISCSGQVTIIKDSSHRAEISLAAGSSLELTVPEWDETMDDQRSIFLLDSFDKPFKRIAKGDNETVFLRAAAEEAASYLLCNCRKVTASACP